MCHTRGDVPWAIRRGSRKIVTQKADACERELRSHALFAARALLRARLATACATACATRRGPLPRWHRAHATRHMAQGAWHRAHGTGRMAQGACYKAHGTGRMAQGGTPLMRSARGAHLPRHTPRSTCVVRHAPLSTLSPPTMRPAPRHRTTCGDVDGPVTAVSSNDATKPPPPASNGPVAALPVAALPAAAVPLAAAPLAAASCASCGSLQQVRRRGARADAVLLPA